MSATALHYALRGWYEGDSPARIMTLRCDRTRIWLGGMLLSQKLADNTVIVNNFHWSHVEDTELRALVEALPWDRMVFVCADERGDRLTPYIYQPSATRTFERIVEHPMLGIGPVVSETAGRLTCMLGGRMRNFVASDVLENGPLIDLAPVFQHETMPETEGMEGDVP